VKAGSLRVIDTNVLLVANRQHPNVSTGCVVACVQALDRIRKDGAVAIDDENEILSEYTRKMAPNTGNRVGDGFLKWLFQNAGDQRRVVRVHIERHDVRGYAAFPDDAELHRFDRSDRKFVAVAASHSSRPPILQATDSKWMHWSERLSSHGIAVEFLCPGDVAGFIKRKRRKREA
jgi:hypothetical protein